MAQAGEIRFDAVIDTSGYEKGVKDIQNATDEIKGGQGHRRRWQERWEERAKY